MLQGAKALMLGAVGLGTTESRALTQPECDLCRSPYAAQDGVATAAHTEPVSQFPIILRVEDCDVGVFAGLKAPLARLQMKRARAVVGGGSDRLGGRHLHVSTGRRQYERH